MIKLIHQRPNFFSEYYCYYSFIIREFTFNSRFFLNRKPADFDSLSAFIFIKQISTVGWSMKFFNLLLTSASTILKIFIDCNSQNVFYESKRLKKRGRYLHFFYLKNVSVEHELSEYYKWITIVFAKKIWSVMNKFN